MARASGRASSSKVAQPSDALRATVTYGLDASEPGVAGGQVKEPRRPRHSGSIAGRQPRPPHLRRAIAYTGERRHGLDVFPAQLVRFDPIGWPAPDRLPLTGQLEAHLRVASL
jgi:hypothetical protein